MLVVRVVYLAESECSGDGNSSSQETTGQSRHHAFDACRREIARSPPALLGQQLKRLAAAGKLVRVKASFKLSDELKKVSAAGWVCVWRRPV